MGVLLLSLSVSMILITNTVRKTSGKDLAISFGILAGFAIGSILVLKQLAKITGRSKHGAHILCANENIIQIKTDENVYNFCPQLKGKLLEINQNLAKNPQLLVESPEKNGFICLIQQEPNDVEALREKLGKPENLIIKYN